MRLMFPKQRNRRCQGSVVREASRPHRCIYHRHLMCEPLEIRTMLSVLAQYDFTGAPGNQASTAAAYVDSNMTASNVTRGPGITAQAYANSMTSTNWTTSTTPDQNDYYSFGVWTPSPGSSMTLTSLQWATQVSSDGPTKYKLRSSLDNFTTDVDYGDFAYYTMALEVNLWLGSKFSNLTGPIEFRLYGYGNLAGSSTGQLRLLDYGNPGSLSYGLFVEGTVQPPASNAEITVLGNGVSIADGDTTPITSDWTDFGSVVQGGSPVSRTFTIRNDGTANLIPLGLSVPTGFTVTDGLVSSLAPGLTDSLVVRLDTATAGTKSGQISFATNDSDENPFNFTITGTVDPLPPALPGDYNLNDIVDEPDCAMWKLSFGQSVTSGTGADGNGDATVDAADYTVWRDNLGRVSGPPDIVGDFDRSGVVDDADYALWKSLFGRSGDGWAADGNGDGVVDAADYTVWRDNLGATAGTGTAVVATDAEETADVVGAEASVVPFDEVAERVDVVGPVVADGGARSCVEVGVMATPAGRAKPQAGGALHGGARVGDAVTQARWRDLALLRWGETHVRGHDEDEGSSTWRRDRGEGRGHELVDAALESEGQDDACGLLRIVGAPVRGKPRR